MLVKTSRRAFLAGAAAMAARPARALAPETGKVEFSFIQVTDSHVSKNRLFDARRGFDVPAEESIRRARAAVKDINACSLPYEMVIHTGDVAHTRDTNDDFDLAREIHEFKRPAYFIPGNHDVGYSDTARYRPEFEKRFGKSNQALEPVPGLRLVLIDSQPLDPRAPDEHREEAFAVMDKLLTPAKPTLFFCHVMGLPSFHLNRMWDAWPEDLMQRWTARLKKGGVMAVMAGHFHRDEQHLVDGLPFYLAGPVVNMWGRQTCYRHWTLSGGRLAYRTVYLEL